MLKPITVCKRLLGKAKVKSIMKYDDLAACFGNKVRFMKQRSNYFKLFEEKLSIMRCVIYHMPIFI